MNYKSIWEEFGGGADLVLSATVSQVRRKENTLKFCTEKNEAYQLYAQTVEPYGINNVVHFSAIGKACIPEEDWGVCPECRKD